MMRETGDAHLVGRPWWAHGHEAFDCRERAKRVISTRHMEHGKVEDRFVSRELLHERVGYLITPFENDVGVFQLVGTAPVKHRDFFWLCGKLLAKGSKHGGKLIEGEGDVNVKHGCVLLLCPSSKQRVLLGHGVLLTSASWQHAHPRSILQALGSTALLALADTIIGGGGLLPLMTKVFTGGISTCFCLWVGALHALVPPLPTM